MSRHDAHEGGTAATGGNPATVAAATRALGFAGLLPQLAVVLVQVHGTLTGGWEGGLFVAACAGVALIYGALILSFLGGIWWGFAMHRGQRQGTLALMAVAPSLVAFALVVGAIAMDIRWMLVALGSAIMLTLPVDRHLVRTGEAPAGWMRLRIPLSLGLGALTIAAGALTPMAA